MDSLRFVPYSTDATLREFRHIHPSDGAIYMRGERIQTAIREMGELHLTHSANRVARVPAQPLLTAWMSKRAA